MMQTNQTSHAEWIEKAKESSERFQIRFGVIKIRIQIRVRAT